MTTPPLLKRKKQVIITIFFVLSLAIGSYFVAPSPTSLPMTKNDDSCRCDSASLDPFEEPKSYSRGRYQGICIDSCKYRSGRQVTSPIQDQPVLHVANLYHEDSFWTAKLPIKEIQSAHFVFEEFRPHINHTAVKIEFKRPIELKSQTDIYKVAFIKNILISPEGIPVKDQKYNFLDGILGNYTVAYRLESFKAYEAVARKLNHKLSLYELSLEEVNMGEFISSALQTSQKESYMVSYNLFLNNCATTTLSLLVASQHPENIEHSTELWTSSLNHLAHRFPLSEGLGTLWSLRVLGFVKGH